MRNPVDLTIRALKVAVANWQLVAIRMVEGVVFVFLTIMALLATIIPVAVNAGLGKLTVSDSGTAIDILARFLVEQRALILWTFGVLILVTGVMLVVHSLIVAGSARVYLDAEHVPGEDFAVFRGEAFWAAAKRGFWRVFWIYNIAWALAGLLILLPVLFALVVVLIARDMGGVIFALVFFGGAMVVAIPICIITSIWVGRALIDGERGQLPAGEALKVARRAIRADLGSHAAVVLLVMIISIGGMMVLSGMANAFSTGGDIFNPLQLFGSVAQTLAGSLASAWMLAAFAALAENRASPSSNVAS